MYSKNKWLQPPDNDNNKMYLAALELYFLCGFDQMSSKETINSLSVFQ